MRYTSKTSPTADRIYGDHRRRRQIKAQGCPAFAEPARPLSKKEIMTAQIQCAYDGLFEQTHDQTPEPGQTFYNLVSVNNQRQKIPLPSEIKMPETFTDEAFLASLASIPGVGIRTHIKKECGHRILVLVMKEAASRFGGMTTEWFIYCPLCNLVKKIGKTVKSKFSVT